MPSWYAIAALSDARDATESLLRPVDRGRWLRLALIALFVGVGGGLPSGGGNASLPSGNGMPSETPSFQPPDVGSVVAVVVAILAVIVAIALLWGLVGAVMEFVLVRGLRDREVSIREPFREEFRPGLRLFGFRIVVSVLTLLTIALPVLLVIVGGVGLSPILLVLLVPLLVLFVAVGIATSVVLGLTTDFVVPTMLTEDRGVLDAWRRLWPTLRTKWKQVALYVVAKFVLGIVVSLAVSIVVLLVAVAVAIPFAVVGGLLFLGLNAAGAGHAAWFVLVPLAALFVLAMIVLGLLVQVPALTFVRYYSLSVLGMLVPELDLVGVERPDGDDGPEDGDGTDGDDGPEDGDGTDGDDGPEDGDGTDGSGPTTAVRGTGVPAAYPSSS
ncbi:DUF7544 domain-containing protein [Haloplanus pelagicus]|jgi:hypothetical protein|uniref:DUF7544 domain-containing protein n=1 Tax=Haloplanus pelagicus TaxID=2949995 RepID=UPI002040F627|nr:hypothetical protein [Haloplanus sp. HW8-1]